MKKIFVLLTSVIFMTACSLADDPDSAEQTPEESEASINEEQLEAETANDTIQGSESNNDTDSEETSIKYNSSGNILEGGKYILADEWIYFVHIMDQHLYKMTSTGINVEKLTDHPVANLHIVEEWIYYTQIDETLEFPYPQSINKIKLDGSERQVVFDQPVNGIYASGDYLLFIPEDKIHALHVKTDEVSELPYQAFSMSVDGNTIIYYNHDGYHLGDLEGSDGQKLFHKGTGDFIIDGEDLYYTVSDGVGGNSGLYRYSLQNRDEQKVIDEKVDYFNVEGDTIYYSTSQAEVDRSLLKVNKNGDDKQNVEAVIYSIHIFDDYVIGEFGRQGFFQYTLIDRDTHEITDIIPEF